MATRILSLLPTFIALLLLVFTATATSDSPFIVAHKKASLKRLKSGVEHVIVTIDIYNEGFATAYDVSLNDDSWPKSHFEVVSSNTTISWEKLEAGSQLSHSIELEAKVKGRFEGAPAVIKYRVPTKAALQEAYSTPILPLDLLEERTPEAKFDWAMKLFAKYGSLISVISAVALFAHIIATPSSKSNAGKASKKRR